MTKFTPADRDYIKASLQRIRELAYEEGLALGRGDERGASELNGMCEDELSRLCTFADGCTFGDGK